MISRTKIFRTNGSQALRLPEGVAFPEGVKEVAIIRDGARRVIVPADSVWDDFFAAPGVDIGEPGQFSRADDAASTGSRVGNEADLPPPASPCMTRRM